MRGSTPSIPWLKSTWRIFESKPCRSQRTLKGSTARSARLALAEISWRWTQNVQFRCHPIRSSALLAPAARHCPAARPASRCPSLVRQRRIRPVLRSAGFVEHNSRSGWASLPRSRSWSWRRIDKAGEMERIYRGWLSGAENDGADKLTTEFVLSRSLN